MAPKGAKSLRTMQKSKIRKFKSKFAKATQWLRTIPNRTHMFRRIGARTLIYANGVGSIAVSGTPFTDSGITLSSVSSDVLTGCYQFGWSHYFSLNNITTTSDFTSLFDRYKIVGVKYRIYYHQNSADVSGGQLLPMIQYSIDNDDAAAPSSIASITSRGDCKTKILGGQQYISLYIRPKVATTAFQSGVSSAYAVDKAKWINSAYPNVEHYGIKVWCNNVFLNSTNTNHAFSIEPVYYLAMRDTL